MGERLVDNRLEELRNQGKNIYSISRLDCINHCLYEAYRTYILNDRGSNNIYAIMGGRIHDTLEGIVNGEKTEADLLPAMNAEFEEMDMLGIDFPNENIRDGWVKDMEHFCKTYKSPKNAHLETEQLIIYHTPGDNYVQGYIDLQRINKDGSIDIYDYKTSSMYSKADMISHGRQLIVYALGKEQEGKKVNSISWIFLKYCEVRFIGKKTIKSKDDTLISKVIERKKLGKEMYKFVEQDLDNAGYDVVDAGFILDKFVETNMFDVLPEEIAKKYKLLPYVCTYELTDELREECAKYIDDTINMWENMDGSDISLYKPREFTKVQKNGKIVEDTFFCCALCGHFKNCPYIHDYLDQKNADIQEEDEDWF